MDYNNILNNKRKLNELKNKTKSILEKATDKLTEVTSTAVDTVVDKVKYKSQQQAKVFIFQDVVAAINAKLIENSVDNTDYKAMIFRNKKENEMSVEEIIENLASSYGEPLSEILVSKDYVDAIFELVKVHYKYEKEIKFEALEDIFTIKILHKDVEPTETKSDIEENKDEHTCDCEPKCDICNCNQEVMTLEYIDNK